MNLELGTQLVRFINVGMYNSELSSEEVLYDEEITDEYWDTFDNKKYTQFIFESGKDVFNNSYLPQLKSLDLDIISGEAVRIESPKSYNYGSDELYFDLVIKGTVKESWDKYFENVDQGNLNKYLQESNKSYDGFISFMPQSIEELEDLINSGEDDERAFAAILNYELDTNDDNEYQEELMETVNNDKYMHDFFSEETEVSEKFVKTFESWKNNM
jgi:hypothetical protein